MRKTNKALYESIMSKVSRVVKRALNEDGWRSNAPETYKLWSDMWGDIALNCQTFLDKLAKKGIIEYEVDCSYSYKAGCDPNSKEVEIMVNRPNWDCYDFIESMPSAILVTMRKPNKRIGQILYNLVNVKNYSLEDFIYGGRRAFIELNEETYNTLSKIR